MKRAMKQLAAVLSVGALSVGIAHAQPIDFWDYTNEAGFAAFAPAAQVTPSGDSGDILNLPTTLTWGPNNNSSLVAGSPVSGTIQTNGAPQPGVALTHNNFPIALGVSLDTATLASVLTLTPSGGGPTIELPTLLFDILFIETENFPAGGNCLGSGMAGSGENTNGCQDIFVLANPEILDTDITFNFDGFEYEVIVTPTGLEFLTDEACAAVGEGPGCLGFLTPENTQSIFTTFFSIRVEVAIPEPHVLGLLGIALTGLGLTRRRRR